MLSCQLIVCEKTSHWAPALRLALGGRLPQVVETRSLAGCERALAESPASLVAVEASSANLEPVVEFVTRIGRQFPQSALVGLVGAEVLAASALLQDAGVIAVSSSVLEAPRLARLAQRQFARWPHPEIDLRELVRQQMPWPAHATA